MKKIVAAWIEQILEFPSKIEYLAYMESLKNGKPKKFKQVLFEQLEAGVIRIVIRKQYNNNVFPEYDNEKKEDNMFKIIFQAELVKIANTKDDLTPHLSDLGIDGAAIEEILWWCDGAKAGDSYKNDSLNLTITKE